MIYYLFKNMERQTEVLSQEHKNILKVINVLENKIEVLKSTGKFDKEFFEQAIDFIKNYADRFHHSKEEDILFIEFNKKAELAHCNPVDQMFYEHSLGREFVVKIEKGLLEDDIDMIAENTLGYASLLRDHILKEDNILYPMINEVLTPKTQKSIMERSKTIEQEKFEKDFLKKYLLFVDELK